METKLLKTHTHFSLGLYSNEEHMLQNMKAPKNSLKCTLL